MERLIEIYEETLGPEIIAKKKPSVPHKWLSRTWKSKSILSKLLAQKKVLDPQGLVIGQEKARYLYQATQEALALQFIDMVSELKGIPFKIGQMFSYVDLGIDHKFKDELKRLSQSSVYLDFQTISDIYFKEHKRKLVDDFVEVSPVPIAVASIGQVHKAISLTGETIALKFQYPHIEDAIKNDFKNANILNFISKVLYRTNGVFDHIKQLENALLLECDYNEEAKWYRFFRQRYQDHADYYVPKVYSEYSSKRILATEFIEAQDFYTFQKMASNKQKNQVGMNIYKFVLESIFVHRNFYYDPNPGNFLFKDEKIILLDFGGIQPFDDKMLLEWKKLLSMARDQDFANIKKWLMAEGFVSNPDNFDFEYTYQLILEVSKTTHHQEDEYEFSAHDSKKLWQLGVTNNPSKFTSSLPPYWLFTLRLPFGLFSLLGELNTRGDFKTCSQEILSFTHEA